MENKPTLFDKILYDNLRPWLSSNNPDDKFAPIISDIVTVYSEHPLVYEIDFYRPFNNKTRYYNKLIINETNRYCNKIINLINDDHNTLLQKYWLNDTLNKKLQTRLKDIGKIIRDNDYQLAYINPRKTSFNIDTEQKTNTYIIQLLKLALIKVYLEIQETFKSLLSDDLKIEDDFYTQFLFEPVPALCSLKKITVVDVQDENIISDSIVVPDEESKFNPVKLDFRIGYKGKLSYDDIVKKGQFQQFEIKLFEYGYIDENYNFTNAHGKKKELAAIFHILIQKKYFREKNYKYQRKFNPAHYRQYLDFRYNLDSTQQFRKTGESYIQYLVDKYYWINNLL